MNRDVTVREVVNREYVGVSEGDSVIETVELLVEEETDTALVLRGTETVGLLTDRDVVEALAAGSDLADATVEEVMRASVPTIPPDATIGEAATRVSTERPHRLVVTDGEEPLGVLTERDVLATRPGPADAERESPGEPVSLAVDDASAETATGTGTGTAAGDTFEEQSICEGCGTLTGDLVSFNGQLLCSDCRDI